MFYDFNDFYYFVKVVECGGFVVVGCEMGIFKLCLLWCIVELEECFQVCLLYCMICKLVFMEVGECYLQYCCNLLLEVEMVEQVIVELSVELCGWLCFFVLVVMVLSNLVDLLLWFFE